MITKYEKIKSMTIADMNIFIDALVRCKDTACCLCQNSNICGGINLESYHDDKWLEDFYNKGGINE